jgi:hypothetical protein
MSDPDHKTARHRANIKPVRFESFAHFFKSYMSVSSVIVAALPIPVAAWKLIPIKY